MAETEQSERVFGMVGGDLSLDFTNTVGGRRDLDGLDREYLTSYEDLVAWGRQAGIISEVQAGSLLAAAKRHPRAAGDALERAVALRETVYRLFFQVAEGRSPLPGDLESFNLYLGTAMSHLRVEPGPEGFAWGWERDPAALDSILWPVARAAGELLVSGELDRVRTCGGDDCGWLFVDRSRNRSRHWCDMRDCGNRAKARRHYHSVKRTRSTSL